MTNEEAKSCERWHKWYSKLQDVNNGNMSENDFIDEVINLEAQIDSLSDIMARQENELRDKDREISKLQKMLIRGDM